MDLFYEGVNITGDVGIVECFYNDRCGDRCDSVELVLENPTAWFGWEPAQDDRIIVETDTISTGTMYLNSILPQDGKYRLVATSVPCATRRTAYQTYENMKLESIMASCAAECGMTNALYGVDGDISYLYLLRQMQSGAAFMCRQLELEGAVFKTFNNRFIGIGIDYAQQQEPALSINVMENQPGLRYQHRENTKLAGITVKTPWAECTAEDSAVKTNNYHVITTLPAIDTAQAARWARGLLMKHNRQAEALFLDMELLPAMTAMVRVDINANSSLAGEWLVEAARHDMKRHKSNVKLLRRIDTI